AEDLSLGARLDRLELDLLVTPDLRDFLLKDLLGALIGLGAFTSENLGVDDRTVDAGRNTQRGVANVASLLAEDRSQELLFRGELRLALRRDLTHQNVARLNLGSNSDDTTLVKVLEGLFTYIRDITSDFFLAELRVSGNALELLDVDRGERVLADQFLTD